MSHQLLEKYQTSLLELNNLYREFEKLRPTSNIKNSFWLVLHKKFKRNKLQLKEYINLIKDNKPIEKPLYYNNSSPHFFNKEVIDRIFSFTDLKYDLQDCITRHYRINIDRDENELKLIKEYNTYYLMKMSHQLLDKYQNTLIKFN